MKRLGMLLVLVWTLFLAQPVLADPPDESEPFDFWLSEAYVRRLAEEDTILSRTRVTLNQRTKKVHTIDDDCEIHIAATSATQLASPSGIVVEPPNLCKERAAGMPQSSEKKLREELWPKFLDQRVMSRECEVTGFPRIFTEHASGNQDPANPNHVLEIHPALRFECDGSQPVDMTSFLKVYPKMRQIKPATAADCIKNREHTCGSKPDDTSLRNEGANAVTSPSSTSPSFPNGCGRFRAGIRPSLASRLQE